VEEEGGTLDLIRSSLREQILFYQVSNISVSKGEQPFFYRKPQCWGSVTFWCGSGSADPYLWLKDPDPDPTPFFIVFKDANKMIFFFIFFSYTRRHIIFSL
jgi:hypothetical protein